MRCQFCDNGFNEDDIHEHHKHPRFMNNKKGNGQKVYLCKKCHDILHLTIPVILWKFILKDKKEEVIKAVINYTESKIK